MKPSYLIVTLILSLTFSLSHGQSPNPKLTKRGDKLFNKFSYLKAAKVYQSYLPTKDSAYVHRQLADCYIALNDHQMAETYLSKVVEQPKVDVRFMYEYAEILAEHQKYEKANIWYENYNSLVPADKRVIAKLGAVQNISNFFRDTTRYTIDLMKFNSEGNDFAPAFYQDGLVFASSRPTFRLTGQRKFNWDKSPFLDFYFSRPNQETADFFSKRLNSTYHEGPLSFYNQDSSLVFTRNNQNTQRNNTKLERDSIEVVRLKILFSRLQKDNIWTDPTEFEYNDDSYSIGHPTMTQDGKTMIFASDMPGSDGQSDLFISHYQNGKWSKPKNMGDEVNTAGRDSFPFMIGDNLFFASDGHGGLGGLDIFVVKLNDFIVVSKPVNLGYPVNTSRDDFGLITTSDFSEGYFTSNREGSQKDDIYYFIREERDVRGMVYNTATNEPLPFSQVTLFDPMTNSLRATVASDSAKFVYEEVQSPATFAAALEGFTLDDSVKFAGDYDQLVKIYMTPIPVIEDTILLAPIYYDFDLFNLRDKSVNELDNVLTYLNRYPESRIELAAHTDSRGPKGYNIRLSNNRAKEAFDYLVKNGIDPERLEPKGYGETQLTNECADKVRCSKEEHQLNRRTEFIVLDK